MFWRTPFQHADQPRDSLNVGLHFEISRTYGVPNLPDFHHGGRILVFGRRNFVDSHRRSSVRIRFSKEICVLPLPIVWTLHHDQHGG